MPFFTTFHRRYNGQVFCRHAAYLARHGCVQAHDATAQASPLSAVEDAAPQAAAPPLCQPAPTSTWRPCVAQAVPTCLHGHVPGSSPRGRRAGSVLSYMCAFVRRHALGLLAGAVVTLGCVVAVQQQRIRWLSSTAASAAADAENAAANAARLEQVANSLYESYKNASGEARGAQAQLRRAQVLVGEMQQQYTAALGRPLTCLASVFGWRSRRHVWLD